MQQFDINHLDMNYPFQLKRNSKEIIDMHATNFCFLNAAVLFLFRLLTLLF